jgi:phospholipid N-methyltransferase
MDMDENRTTICRAIAEQYCNRGGNDCRWYHGNWDLLKSLNIVSTSNVHAQDLSRLLKMAIGEKSRLRILMTGSTDESLLRIVHDLSRSLEVEAQFTALDICATPLEFMKIYAARNSIELEAIHLDILDFGPTTRFDIIVTHAFMGNFNDHDRQLLVNKWQELLCEDGKVVTIQRVRATDAPSLVKFSDDQATEFVAGALSAAKRNGLVSSKELAKVEVIATEFSEKFSTYAIRSKSSLHNLFSTAGLKVDCLEYHSLGQQDKLSGPSVPSSGEYAHVVAGKA